MLHRTHVPASLFLMVACGLVALLSCDTNAKPQQATKAEKETAKVGKVLREKRCCMAGFQACPTSHENGCDCCGAMVTATFVSYDKATKTGSLQIKEINDPVPFTVVDDKVDSTLQGKTIGKEGQFVLKLNTYDTKRHKNGKRWEGKRYECEGTDDDGGKLKDRTAEFVSGWNLTGAVYEMRAIAEKLVPQYEPERDADKK